eukprot:CAMPEP_0114579402 /NCGR_PEP_ID=MMETSP0125-20121206/3782_1 /TAXON_ID=485358 ORGANISM="Aristerostoma sp., Strain ATCC 50986" /NCGR_SAMPLE_ID=MMETSP0125 /ASSEMBLY_ACC=CAM_ASM_000245 /LENGTH=151 /DNA_ID=CAMNT_0001770117 /DNA_START=1064 /DNA_END=1515 /DNA_ORIENTATION=+
MSNMVLMVPHPTALPLVEAMISISQARVVAALPYSYDFGDANSLCGGSSFTCDEIEVFQITKEPVMDGQPFGSEGGSGSGPKGGSIPTESLQKVIDYMGVQKSQLNLIYKGSKDGMSPEAFHSKCDNKGPTLVFAKGPNNRLVGGYTTQSW